MKLFKTLSKRLWFNVFIRIAAIFLVFVLILSICNVSMLLSFFCFKEKYSLKEQLLRIEKLDINDTESLSDCLVEIKEKHNFDIEIYNSSGKVIYTTHFGQMMDFYQLGDERFSMTHERFLYKKSEELGEGITYYEATIGFDKSEYLVCSKQMENNLFIDVRIQKSLIESSAEIANEFILIVSCICLVLSVAWVFVFAKKFSKPISEMNETTKAMARLDFTKALDVRTNDEIGELAVSINELSSSLSAALENLRCSNAKLKDEIELERQLDIMRKAFVANVSHELKTPISIISGYAQGLKYNVNSEKKEEYCDTIIDESERMNRLVLSILELSKYESGQVPLDFSHFDIFEVAEQLLIRIFDGKEIRVCNEIEPESIVFADKLQIEQVLKSLLENALCHTNGEVRVYSQKRKETLRVCVFNTGSHIAAEQMPQIWQSFFRGDTSHKRERGRFGLGLSIVSAIMKLHKTNCGVKNLEGGVEFWFEVKI